MTSADEFPAWLLRERRRLGATQRELAIALGVTETTISRWEQGVVPPQSIRLVKLAFKGLQCQ